MGLGAALFLGLGSPGRGLVGDFGLGVADFGVCFLAGMSRTIYHVAARKSGSPRNRPSVPRTGDPRTGDYQWP